MESRTLERPPRILPLYARAAAPLLPGASLLPFVPGGGGEIPPLELNLREVAAEPEKVADYARVCGFALRDRLPPTYPHILAFPLQMAVMADGSFPFGAVGLVHIQNTIAQQRPIGVDEKLAIRVVPTALQPHPRGRTFSLRTEARIDGRLVWEETSTMLRRGRAEAEPAAIAGAAKAAAGEDRSAANANWKLPADLGRRYAAVSGDRNPIHMHALTAKPLGFPAAIAHGMWTKAHCLAALEACLPESFEVEVRFRRPILLPSRVGFVSAREGEETEFAVRDAKRGTPHLDGHLAPLESKSEDGRN